MANLKLANWLTVARKLKALRGQFELDKYHKIRHKVWRTKASIPCCPLCAISDKQISNFWFPGIEGVLLERQEIDAFIGAADDCYDPDNKKKTKFRDKLVKFLVP